jgi:hypothetical protein
MSLAFQASKAIPLTGHVVISNYSQSEIRITNTDITTGITTFTVELLKNQCFAKLEQTSVYGPLSIVIGAVGLSSWYYIPVTSIIQPSGLPIDQLITLLNGWFLGAGAPISVNGGALLSPLYGINFIEGANITITTALDYVNNVTNVTISAAGGGGFAYTVVNVNTTPYNIVPVTGIYVYLVDATAGSITINFPTAVGNTALYTVKKVDASVNTVVLDPNGAETLDGLSTQTIRFQNTSVDIYSDNANLYIR